MERGVSADKTTRASRYTAYLILVEGPGEYYFAPEGLCVVGDNHSYAVYSLDSRHNFLRAAVMKFPLADLLGDGVSFRSAHIKLEDLAPFREARSLQSASATDLMQALYLDNPLRHHFLARYAP
ncbi:MAG: hypothetical protein ACYCVB_04325 [Bacilli bacterium]